jgi:hypothetical protein
MEYFGVLLFQRFGEFAARQYNRSIALKRSGSVIVIVIPTLKFLRFGLACKAF